MDGLSDKLDCNIYGIHFHICDHRIIKRFLDSLKNITETIFFNKLEEA